jgi:uracil phosphoribosyltransferase
VKRTNVYLTEKQVERLHIVASQEGVAMAEVIRRAVEVYLAWNDPTYTPPIPTPKRKVSSSPG